MVLLLYRRRFLALASAQIIQFRAAGFAFLFHFHLGDARRMQRKNAFDAFAVGYAANGKSFVQPASFAANDDARKDLDPFLVPLDHASVHTNAVADFEVSRLGLLLLFFDRVDNAVHIRKVLPRLDFRFANAPRRGAATAASG